MALTINIADGVIETMQGQTDVPGAALDLVADSDNWIYVDSLTMSYSVVPTAVGDPAPGVPSTYVLISRVTTNATDPTRIVNGAPTATLATNSVTPDAAGSALINTSVGNIAVNPNFISRSRGIAPPDGFDMAAGVWGVDVDLDTSEFDSGDASILVPAGKTGELRSIQLPLPPFFDTALPLLLRLRIKGTSGDTVGVTYGYYNNAGISTTTGGDVIVVNDDDTWETHLGPMPAPSTGDQFISVSFVGQGAANDLWIDSWELIRVSPYATGNATDVDPPPTLDDDPAGHLVPFSPDVYGIVPVGVDGDTFEVKVPGRWQFGATLYLPGADAGTHASLTLEIDFRDGVGFIPVATSISKGDDPMTVSTSSPPILIDYAAQFRWRLTHDSATDITLPGKGDDEAIFSNFWAARVLE
jgi:hypothetical protein